MVFVTNISILLSNFFFTLVFCESPKISPTITIVTGTHVTNLHESLSSKTQSLVCQAINQEIRNTWSVFNECKQYTKARKKLVAGLKLLKENENCIFGGTPKDYLYTFPHTTKSDAKCDQLTQRMVTQKTYAENGHKVLVPWFLIRPDLVTLERMCALAGVKLKILATIGYNIKTSAFATEGCPRIRTVTEKRDIYQQMLLLVMVSDLRHQLNKLKNSEISLNICEDINKDLNSISDYNYINSSNARVNFIRKDALKRKENSILQCQNSEKISKELIINSHIPSMMALDWNLKSKKENFIKKKNICNKRKWEK